jgi:hypothetical protein
VHATELAADAAAAVAAGATHVHVHPRDQRAARPSTWTPRSGPSGRRCPACPSACRRASGSSPTSMRASRPCAAGRRRRMASVNLSEDGHAAVMDALAAAGVGSRRAWRGSRTSRRSSARGSRGASCACSSSPRRTSPRRRWPPPRRSTRRSTRAAIGAPRVHHGYGLATWAVLRRAVREGHGLRAGLEDALVHPTALRRPPTPRSSRPRRPCSRRQRVQALAVSPRRARRPRAPRP